LWLDWKRRVDPSHYLDPEKRFEAGAQAGLDMVKEGLINEDDYYGTINCNGVNWRGEVCGVTTTSGLAWKIPGRVGDSPILGAGLYVDGEVGAAGSTGRGEANLYGLLSYLIVVWLAVIPDRRRNASRQAPERCQHGGAAPGQAQHDRIAAIEQPGNA
jgi:N4-(beta-N-acetylglucosaminyl)-L-asparaginase